MRCTAITRSCHWFGTTEKTHFSVGTVEIENVGQDLPISKHRQLLFDRCIFIQMNFIFLANSVPIFFSYEIFQCGIIIKKIVFFLLVTVFFLHGHMFIDKFLFGKIHTGVFRAK